MDESHTHRMLESLADLFLTNTQSPQEPTSPPEAPPDSSADPRDLSPDFTPPLELDSDSDTPSGEPEKRIEADVPLAKVASIAEQLEGPPPIRLAPKLQVSRPAATVLPVTEPESEPIVAAALEPLRPSFGGAPPIVRPPTELVEAVFVSSLPGVAGPWLTQYAQQRASGGTLVGLMRLDDGQIDLELVGRPAPRSPKPIIGDDLSGTLASVQAVGLWLLNVPVTAAAQWLDRLGTVDRWTILCGSDEAAQVTTHRLIKQLLEMEEVRCGGSHADRRIGLMVMGCELQQAVVTVSNVNLAVASLVGRPVELAGTLKEMGPVTVQLVGSFTDRPEAWPNILAAMRCSASAVPPPPEPSQSPVHELGLSRSHMPEPQERESPEPQFPQPQAAESLKPVRGAIDFPDLVRPARSTLQEVDAVPQEAADPFPNPAPSAADSEDHIRESANAVVSGLAGEPDLSMYLEGAIPLAARCPHHPQTQLAIDEEGRVHLLCWQGSGGDAELRGLILDLMETRAWAHEHIELLQLTQRQCRFDTAEEPRAHLFTDQAKKALGMIGRRGSTVNIHLLQQVSLGNESTWVCNDLS